MPCHRTLPIPAHTSSRWGETNLYIKSTVSFTMPVAQVDHRSLKSERLFQEISPQAYVDIFSSQHLALASNCLTQYSCLCSQCQLSLMPKPNNCEKHHEANARFNCSKHVPFSFTHRCEHLSSKAFSCFTTVHLPFWPLVLCSLSSLLLPK